MRTPNTNCSKCDIPIYVRPAKKKLYVNHFCGRICYSAFRHAERSHAIIKVEKRYGRIREVVCVWCPAEFWSMAWKNGRVLEHRLVAAKKLGRHLLPSEVVHHEDGNSLNNDPENLIIFENQVAHMKHEALSRSPF